MSRNPKLLLIGLFCLLIADAIGQGLTTDTLRLPSVEISAKPRLQYTPGAVVTTIDSSDMAGASENAATMLRMHSTAFIKSYGQNGSSTISIRGTEARHTAVLWNGFNINSASLGLTDLSLVPAEGFNGFSLIHGGASGVYGNSSLGGTLVLDQPQIRFGEGTLLRAKISGGGLGTFNGSGSVTVSEDKFWSATSFLISHANNNFDYVNTAQKDNPVVTQTHADFSSISIKEDLSFKAGVNSYVSGSVWYQVAAREVPPTMMEAKSDALQRDSILRVFLGWKKTMQKFSLDVNTAFFDEHQRYQDDLHEINAFYKLRSWLGNIQAQHYVIEKLTIIGELSYASSQAAFDEYGEDRTRQTFSFHAGALYEANERTSVSLNLRKEYTTYQDAPFCPSIHLESGVVKDILNIHVSGGRNYNIPSMNDLYWQPGGNTQLLPEDSWNTEAGVTLFPEVKRKPKFGFAAYYAVTDNWIKWVPVDGGTYHASNIDKVKSRGIETFISYTLNRENLMISFKCSYAYTQSTREETSPGHEALQDKQLIYIPYHTAAGNLAAVFKSWELRYDHNYTGMRYTTADNNSSLDAFQVADLYLGKHFAFQNMQISAYVKALNVWDTDYQVVAWRPMPGRWFMAGITFQYHNKKQHHNS